MTERDGGTTRCSLASPEVCCGMCLVQTTALFFIWEAALCGWGVSEECYVQFLYEGRARISERTSAWMMMILGLLGLGLSGLYWMMILRRIRAHMQAVSRRRARRRAGTDEGDISVQRERLIEGATPRASGAAAASQSSRASRTARPSLEGWNQLRSRSPTSSPEGSPQTRRSLRLGDTRRDGRGTAGVEIELEARPQLEPTVEIVVESDSEAKV